MVFKCLVMAFLFASVLMADAHAYLDPGTGGMLLQLLLGGVAGFLYVIKLYYATLKAKIRNIFCREKR